MRRMARPTFRMGKTKVRRPSHALLWAGKNLIAATAGLGFDLRIQHCHVDRRVRGRVTSVLGPRRSVRLAIVGVFR
jgi:hypothetical protein